LFGPLKEPSLAGAKTDRKTPVELGFILFLFY
jgi:hypothetical protein